jgi:hypothetical protein
LFGVIGEAANHENIFHRRLKTFDRRFPGKARFSFCGAASSLGKMASHRELDWVARSHLKCPLPVPTPTSQGKGTPKSPQPRRPTLQNKAMHRSPISLVQTSKGLAILPFDDAWMTSTCHDTLETINI